MLTPTNQRVERCKQQLCKIDIFGRYGGEEFSILLPEENIVDARTKAERLLNAISGKSITSEHGELSVTISPGVALFEHNSMVDLGALLKHADRVLDKAKKGTQPNVRA